MQLSKKRDLIARSLKVGKNRITLNINRIDEIKEIITKQDVRDLLIEKAISVKEPQGKKKLTKRKTRRRGGSIKKKVKKRKYEYMAITRKLRTFISELRDKEIIVPSEYWQLRKEIRAKAFKSKANMKERLNQMIKNREQSGK